MRYWNYSIYSLNEKRDTVALGTNYIDNLDDLKRALDEIYKLPLSRDEKELTEGITLQVIIRRKIVE